MTDKQSKLLSEDVISLSDAAKEIGSLLPGERGPHIATMHRWVLRGIKGTKLESLRVGAKVYTSRQAVTRFLNKTSV